MNELSARHLGEGADSPGAKTEEDSSEVHTEGQWGGSEESTEESTVANHDQLDVEFSEEDNPEPEVSEWVLEEVVFNARLRSSLSTVFSKGAGFSAGVGHVINDTAVEHVEEVHEDENLEQKSLVELSVGREIVTDLELFFVKVVSDVASLSFGAVTDRVHEGASEEKDVHDEELVDALGKDSAHHWLGDDLIVLLNAVRADLLRRVLSGESNSGKDVHDQVDPEELHDAEWRVAKDKSGRENEDHAGEVDGHLELNEFAYVILNVTAPSDRGNDSEEVIVHKDNVSVVLGGGASVLAEGETNISLGESTRVTQTFTGDTNHGSGLSEGAGKHVFKFRGGSVDDGKLVLNLLEFVLGILGLELVGETTTFVKIFLSIHHLLELGEEFSGFHADFRVRGRVEAKFVSDGEDRGSVVTRDDSDVSLGLVQLKNGLIDVFSERIGETNGGNEGELALNLDASNLIFKFVVLLAHGVELVGGEVSEGDSESLEASIILSSWLDNVLFDDLRKIFSTLLLVSSEAGWVVERI